MSLKTIFAPEVIDHFKRNKHEITFELLEELRSFGNEGKQLALEILDTHQDHENYYLDSFGSRIAFDGNRTLKKPFTKMDLFPIHLEEIERCHDDIFYFMDNYLKLVTKSGINFPELREYQRGFIETILPDENDAIVSPQPRQSGKSTTVGIYLSHCALFKKDINIGICANKAGMAREFLDKVKKMYVEIPMWMKVGQRSWNKSSVEFENGVRIMTDATSGDSFRGYSIHLLIVDETAFIRPSIWNEFADSIFPSQGALSWKKNILISTSNGMNHFYDIVKRARKGSNGYAIHEVNWRDVPRFNSDGSVKDPDKFREEVIAKYGEVYWAQNYELAFIGSSHTLISADKLSNFESSDPITVLQPGLRIFSRPQKGHKYFMAVDPSKDGADAFAIQIVDITDFKFKQVAVANLQIDYLQMPDYIDEWARFYNNAFLIIENNEGAGQSIADQMYHSYEYENMYFDTRIDNASSGKRKKYPGFRTTSKSRKLILQTLKTFIENDILEIYDSETISEFYQFVLINGKFQADDGAHDDLIMALAIIFAPFCNMKNFEDMKEFIKKIFVREDITEDDEKRDITELFTFGSFDDGTAQYEEDVQFRRIQEGYLDSFGG